MFPPHLSQTTPLRKRKFDEPEIRRIVKFNKLEIRQIINSTNCNSTNFHSTNLSQLCITLLHIFLIEGIFSIMHFAVWVFQMLQTIATKDV